MRKLTLIVFATIGLLAICDETTTTNVPSKVLFTEEQFNALFMKESGGKVRKPGFGRGNIAIVNAQKRVDAETFRVAFDIGVERMRLPITFQEGTLDGEPTQAGVKGMKANFAIYVVDRPESGTTISLAPEQQWAVVNVAALAKDNPTTERLEERTMKEVVRAFGWLCGGANSQYPGTVMGPVAKYTDLDKIGNCIYPFDNYKGTFAYLRGFKVEPYVESTYIRACKEGWAPAPTNEYQQAIWDQVKADKERGPANPIKIPMPTKK
jgi:hypothetical protein